MITTPLSHHLLERLAAECERRRAVPTCTYRLQFHAGFTFNDAAAAIPYLHALGISHVYASPYLRARPGSTHGYDISDHSMLNPEIGSTEEYQRFVDDLRQRSMGQLFDMVPNHMGIVGNINGWWDDVLENGPSSHYGSYFDIDWYSALKAELHEKVLLPILGSSYGEALESGAITLAYENARFVVTYYEHRFPVSPCSWDRILEPCIGVLADGMTEDSEPLLEMKSIITAVRHLPRRNERDAARVAERSREKEVIKRRLAALLEQDHTVRGALERTIAAFNGDPSDLRTFDRLDELLNEQAYRLAHFRVASDEINYRRFFDINELAALNMEKEEVFSRTHRFVLELLADERIQGLRIDHPDGLYDPKGYLERLQHGYLAALAGRLEQLSPDDLSFEAMQASIAASEPEVRDRLRKPLYVLVEKILGPDEPLPGDWKTDGTTGYDFLAVLNGVLVDSNRQEAMSRIYERWTGGPESYDEIVYRSKSLILDVSLSAELHVLAQQLDRLSERDRHSRDFTLNSLREALHEIIACFPVYRSYVDYTGVSDRDWQYVMTAVNRAKRRNPAVSSAQFEFVRRLLLLQIPDTAADTRPEVERFIGKFQQVTAPVTAKGVEDTSFYRYLRLVSLNEVGASPDRFGTTVALFHQFMQRRAEEWPHSMSATATHDTKRGEDTRTRINVLSEMPLEWQRSVLRWDRINAKHRSEVDGMTVPDRHTEYLLYQTLVGMWPVSISSDDERDALVERVQGYMQKAIHEAKLFTSWVSPNPGYDDAVRSFVGKVLGRRNRRFFTAFEPFARRVAWYGMVSSLAQTVLKATLPGAPDVYQGTELWDLSLVDPDNRRPVDFTVRQSLLAELERRARDEPELPRLVTELLETWPDGRIKLFLLWRSLQVRRAFEPLFSHGSYEALTSGGKHSSHVISFARRSSDRHVIVVAPRLPVALCEERDGVLPLGELWDDTAIAVRSSMRYRNVFTGEQVEPEDDSLKMSDVFRTCPVAILTPE